MTGDRNGRRWRGQWRAAAGMSITLASMLAALAGMVLTVFLLAGCGREPLAGTDAGNAGKVAGMLYDEAGRPLAGFPVHLRSADYQAGIQDSAAIRPAQGWARTATTDSRGAYAFLLGATDTGEVVLEVLGREGTGARLAFRREPGKGVDLDSVRLKPSGRIAGAVVLPPLGIGSTAVTLLATGHAAYFPAGAGNFDFPALPEGEYILRVEGIAPVRAAVDTLISLTAGQTVAGLSLIAGIPAAGSPGAVSVRLAFPGPLAGTLKARLGPEGKVLTADSNGVLLFTDVPPGTHALAAWGESPSRDTLRVKGIQVAAGQVTGPVEAKFRIKALIVNGINNHDWQRMTAYTTTILAESDLFEVAVSTTPPDKSPAAQWALWNPRFMDHDVVILHYNSGFGDDGKANPWPDSVMRSLAAFVAAGRGLVNTHANFPAFDKWAAYEEMMGLFWKAIAPVGPSYMLDAGDSLVPIPGSSDSGSYDDSTPGGELIGLVNTGHPINQGLPSAWLHPADLLTYGLKGRPEGITVLAWVANPGSGNREPQQWVKSYGQGRVFTSTLGHLYPVTANAAYRCAGFQATLVRGVEWAATGKVTFPVPADFPGGDSVSLRDNLKD